MLKYYVELKYQLPFPEHFASATNNGSVVDLNVAQAFLRILGKEYKTLTLASGSFNKGTDIYHILRLVQEHCLNT